MTLIPFIIEQEGKSEQAYKIYSRLLKDNIIFIGTEIDNEMANDEALWPATGNDPIGFGERFDNGD